MDTANHIALAEDLYMAYKALNRAYNRLQKGYTTSTSELVDTIEDINAEVVDFTVLMRDILAKEHPEEPNHYKDLYYLLGGDK
jgi:hypothetical protein